MLTQSILQQVPHIIDALKVLGKNDDYLFETCLMGIIEIKGFKEALKWIGKKWNFKKAEGAMKAIEERTTFDKSACDFVREVFLNYNSIITQAIKYQEGKEITLNKFEILNGVPLLWKIVMQHGDMANQRLLEIIYENNHLFFVPQPTHLSTLSTNLKSTCPQY